MALHNKGWSALEFSQMREKHHKAGSLDWYYHGDSSVPNKLYLLALLRAEEFLQPAGCLLMIKHNQKVAYYKELLDGIDVNAIKKKSNKRGSEFAVADAAHEVLIPIQSASASLLDIAGRKAVAKRRGKTNCGREAP